MRVVNRNNRNRGTIARIDPRLMISREALADYALFTRDELKDVNANFLRLIAISRANNSCVLTSSRCIMQGEERYSYLIDKCNLILAYSCDARTFARVTRCKHRDLAVLCTRR